MEWSIGAKPNSTFVAIIEITPLLRAMQAGVEKPKVTCLKAGFGMTKNRLRTARTMNEAHF